MNTITNLDDNALVEYVEHLRDEWREANLIGDQTKMDAIATEGRAAKAELARRQEERDADRAANYGKYGEKLPEDHVETCYKCGGSGVFYFGGAVVNGKFTGKTGECYPCRGTGKTTKADIVRTNVYYAKHYRVPM